MRSAQSELIWQGSVHLGDEPGVYGSSSYVGLLAELPIFVERTADEGRETTVIVVETEGVKTFKGYPGHKVSVVLYVPDEKKPSHWRQVVLAEQRLTTKDKNNKEIPVDLTGYKDPYRIGVRIGVDTEVPAGLYDDFVWTRLANVSDGYKFVASLGFR